MFVLYVSITHISYKSCNFQFVHIKYILISLFLILPKDQVTNTQYFHLSNVCIYLGLTFNLVYQT